MPSVCPKNFFLSDQIIFLLILSESFKCHLANSKRAIRCLLLKVVSVWLLYHKGLIDGVLLRWSSFQQVLPLCRGLLKLCLSEIEWGFEHLPDQCPSFPAAEFSHSCLCGVCMFSSLTTCTDFFVYEVKIGVKIKLGRNRRVKVEIYFNASISILTFKMEDSCKKYLMVKIIKQASVCSAQKTWSILNVKYWCEKSRIANSSKYLNHM